MSTELSELTFTVSGRVARPIAEVYDAVADPEQLSHYFTTAGARGRLEPGNEVTWDFHDYPGRFLRSGPRVCRPRKKVPRR